MLFTVDQNHLLQCDDAERITHIDTTKKSKGKNIADYLVIHYSAGRNFNGDVTTLSSSTRKASAHLVIGRNGGVAQIGNFRDILWHAGRSTYDGLSGMNKYSIGIELSNPGWLEPIGQGKYKSWFGEVYNKDADNLVISKHPTMGNTLYGWLPYTPAQLEACVSIGEALVDKYNMVQVVGHEDISPGRKQDPANNIIFPSKIYDMLNGVNDRSSEGHAIPPESDSANNKNVAVSKVDNLNIRTGPSTRFPRIGQLEIGKAYDIVVGPIDSENAKWTLVQFNDTTQGWVATRFLE